MAQIFYKGFMHPSFLDDSHSREGEVLLALPVQVFLSPEELTDALLEDLNGCARPENLPWEDVEGEIKAFAHTAFHGITAIIERWQADGNDPEEGGGEMPYLYFVVTYK